MLDSTLKYQEFHNLLRSQPLAHHEPEKQQQPVHRLNAHIANLLLVLLPQFSFEHTGYLNNNLQNPQKNSSLFSALYCNPKDRRAS